MTLSETCRLDATAEHWKLLESAIDAFADAWRGANTPPSLLAFLPESSPHIRNLILVELIKVDLDYRWRKKVSPLHVEDYLTRFPGLASDGSAPCELVYEEFHVRKACGEDVQRETFYGRFPQLADELARLLEIGETCTLSVAAARPTLDVEVGGKLDEFEVLAELGRGAFARVFLARQSSLDRTVAIKITAAPRNEARLLAQLDHPHIVRVYDQRVLSDGAHWLLYMEHVVGGSLADMVRLVREAPPTELGGATLLKTIDHRLAGAEYAPGAPSLARQYLAAMSWPNVVCRIGVQLAMALHYAHGCGILHRDLKPANILLTADGGAKLADFNVGASSKLSGAGSAAYFGGTLLYMSPEQLEAYSLKYARTAEMLDGRSDIYSLGVVLWELLTGKRPFVEQQKQIGWIGATERIFESRRVSPDVWALNMLPFSCPKALKDALVQCLQPDPDRRFQDAEQLALALAPFAKGGDLVEELSDDHLNNRETIDTILIKTSPAKRSHSPAVRIGISCALSAVLIAAGMVFFRIGDWSGDTASRNDVEQSAPISDAQRHRGAAHWIIKMGGRVAILRDGSTEPEPVTSVKSLEGPEFRIISIHLENYGAKRAITEGLDRLKGLSTVVSLALLGAAITDRELEIIATFDDLNDLRLGQQVRSRTPDKAIRRGSRISSTGLSALERLRQLTGLALCSLPITDDHLVKLKNLETLDTLDLSGALVTDAGMPQVAELKSLRNLSLSHTAVGDDGLLPLTSLPRLYKLLLFNTNVSDDGMATLVQSRSLRHLHVSNRVTGKGLQELTKAPHFTALGFPGCPINDNDLRHFKHFPHINGLSLQRTNITDAGLVHFEQLSSLRALKLEGASVSRQGIQRLKRALPNCDILQ